MTVQDCLNVQDCVTVYESDVYKGLQQQPADVTSARDSSWEVSPSGCTSRYTTHTLGALGSSEKEIEQLSLSSRATMADFVFFCNAI